MAKEPTAATAASDDVRTATITGSRARGSTHYPTLTVDGDEPEKGATIRVQLDNGQTYSAKVQSARQVWVVETNGLKHEHPSDDAPAPGSDIVPG